MNQIDFFFEQTESFNFQEDLLVKHVNQLINNELRVTGEISVIFCSDDYLLEINKQYLNHDYYTDIITFDYEEEDNIISGDLFISIDRIKENAGNFGVNFIIELYRVVFHGVLHLIGYKDKTDEEQMEMTSKEDFYLNKVDFKSWLK